MVRPMVAGPIIIAMPPHPTSMTFFPRQTVSLWPRHFRRLKIPRSGAASLRLLRRFPLAIQMHKAKVESLRVSELDIPAIFKRKLKAAGFETVGQLLQFCPKRLRFQPHMGVGTVLEVERVLGQQGLHLVRCKRPTGVSLC